MAVRRRSIRYGIVPIASSRWRRAAAASARRHARPVRDAMPAARRNAARDASGRDADLLDLRARARIRADHARDPLLRGRGPARAAAARAARASTASASACASSSSCAASGSGLSLTEIRELLDLYEVGRNERAAADRSSSRCWPTRRALLMQQQEDIDVVLAEIDGDRARVPAAAARSRARRGVTAPPAELTFT